jgi:hypothetical protein
MVYPSEDACFFYGHHVTGLLDHADQPVIATRIAADGTGISFGKGKAAGTEPD